MLNLKKTAVAVLALSSSAAFAGTMGPVCSAVPVTMPCESSGWEVGARALWYNLGAGNQRVNMTSSSGGSISTNVNPNYAWGFQINGSMLYGTGRSVTLDWYHVANTVNGPTGAASLTGNQAFVTGPQFLRGNFVSALSTTARSSSVSPKFNSVNMIFGQHVDFSEQTSANFGFGWNWSGVGATNKVAATGSATYTSNASGSASSQTAAFDFSASNSQIFDGFGPEVALRGDYGLIDNLDIYARGSFAGLAGFSKSALTLTDVTTSATNTLNNSVVAIVPVVDGKLGLSYDWDMPAFAKIVLDVNYDFGSYINALRNSATVGTTGSTASSFNYQGIAFGLDLVFAS